MSRTATDTLDVSKASMPVVPEAPVSPVMTDMLAALGKGQDTGIKEVCAGLQLPHVWKLQLLLQAFGISQSRRIQKGYQLSSAFLRWE